jgi:23S rRNA (uracil1939-C5)-methyltransferase
MEIEIKRLGIYGEGIGEWEGKTVFVHGALPGERVLAEVEEEKKSYIRAKLLSIQSKSPHRVVAPCPVFGRCGGCQIMHLSYPEQLIAKRQRVVDALERIGKLHVNVAACAPSPNELYYRNKIQLPTYFDGQLHMGLYAFNSHEVVEIEKCYIHCERGEEVFFQVRERLKANEQVCKHLRHVLIRSAKGSLVVFVTTKKEVEGLARVAEELMQKEPLLKGVVQNINPSSQNTILGKDYQTLAGQPFIEEEICGLRFKVSAASFFQVNPPVAEAIYKKAVMLGELTGKETVLDAYCGVGTLALIFAGKAARVIGVEPVGEAIVDAKENARLNQITHATFHCNVAERFIQHQSLVDVAVLNPPRKGCDKAVLERLAILKPRTIIYLSCDPATLARDLAILHEKNYKIEGVFPFDMFPQTVHVETLVKLSYNK